MPIFPEAGARQLSRFAITLFSFLLLSASLWAQNTIRVPQDQPTIQAAIDSANAFDTVVVSPGTYVENLTLNFQPITLKSSAGAASTIIDGNGQGTVITISGPMSGVGSLPAIEGFTIRNGSSPTFGGGITVLRSTATINKNRILNNQGCSGGGIYLEGSFFSLPPALVTDNLVSNNNAVCSSAQPFGSGIYITGPGSPKVSGNTISENGTDNGFSTAIGGGIAIDNSSTGVNPEISSNIIKGNVARDGGGIFVGSWPESPLITQNVIVANVAVNRGGGLALFDFGVNSAIVLTNNTFANNDGIFGADVYYESYNSRASFFNNLIVGRRSQAPLDCSGSMVPLFNSNDVFWFSQPPYAGMCADQTGIDGNISADPAFVDEANSNYRLQLSSAAIDAGNGSAPNLLQQDLEGNPRVLDGDDDGVAAVDIGAYEVALLYFSPLRLDFGDVIVGNSKVLSATFTNRSNTSHQFFVRDLTGDTSDFWVSNDCMDSPAGSSCTFTVTFTPHAFANRSATLTIYEWDGQSAKALASLPLKGAGVAPPREPQITINPTSLIFPTQVVGTTSGVQSVILTQIGGTDPLILNNVAVSGPFARVVRCSAATVPCAIDVTFSPVASGPASGVLTIFSNAEGNPHTVSLSGTGINPVATFSPTSLAFTTQLVGTTSSPQSVTLTNVGDSAFEVTGVSASNANFVATNQCPTMLLPGASCTVLVRFTPNTFGPLSAILTLSSNSSVPSTIVNLTGAAILTTVDISPSALSFPPQRVDFPSPAQRITLTNSGPRTFDLNQINGAIDFSLTTTCWNSLAPGASCFLDVTFTPTASGQRTGTLTLISATSGPIPDNIALSGTGYIPVAAISPVNLEFNNQLVHTTSASLPLTLRNTGDGPLSIYEMSVTGAFAQTNSCGSTLAANATCIINVTFTPTSRGVFSGTLTLSSDGAGAAPVVTLAGTGVEPAASLSPSALSFASQRVGTSSTSQAVTLTNTGTASLHITGFPVSGDFAQTNACPATLDAGASCAINVAFTPSATGAREGTLTISSDSSGPAPVVSLSGTGVVSVATMSPNSLAFANQLLGTISSSQPVTLSNTGNATLTITGFPVTGDFSQTNSCGSSLAPGGSCVVNVTFTPSTIGARNGSLTVSSNSVGTALVVSLSGMGVVPIASVTPATLAFAAQLVNTTSAAQSVTLSNTGGASLHISAIAASGDFAQSNGCGSQLAPGGSCTIRVTFSPTATGSRTGALTISSDSAVPAGPISLSGTGTAGALYPFNEGTGSTTADASGNNNTGTLATGATWTAGKYGNGLQFDGTNGRVTVADAPSLDLGNTGTIAAWVKLNSLNRWHGVIAKGAANNDAVHNYALEINNSNRFLCILGDGSNSVTVASSITATTGTFYHLACVWNGTTLQLYVNGAANASATQTLVPASNTASLYIGQFGGNSDRLAGTVDEVRIYNTALSQAQIVDAMNTPIQPATPDTENPVVSITAPAAGALLSGTVTITANASDNVGVAGVQFTIDGANFGAEDVTAPYSISWNTTTVANGSHSISAVARDAAGNHGNAPPVAVTTSNDLSAPTAPPNLTASVVSSTQINLAWNASSDNVGVTGYRITRNGTAIATTIANSYQNTGLNAGTTYAYTVAAYDDAGNFSAESNTATATTPGLPPPAAPVPVASYAFRENTGTTTADGSGNGNQGALTNGPVWAAGKYGSAISFDGVNDYVSVPDSNSLDLGATGTISAWVKLNQVNRWNSVIAKGSANDNALHNYALEIDNANRFLCILGNGTASRAVTSSTAATTGTFYHVACVWDGTTLQLYINGALKASTAQNLTPSGNAASLFIGLFGGNADPLAGVIDEVRIYNRALTQAQIQSDMNSPL